MSVIDRLRSIGGRGQKNEEILGTIVEGPTVVAGHDSSPDTLVFRLDARPELKFRQMMRALSSERKRGDRVRVHCHVNGDGTALVDWIEKA